eukprot:160997-Amphidinium_carterae.1
MHSLSQARKSVWLALMCMLMAVLIVFALLVREVARRLVGLSCAACPCGRGCSRDLKEIGQACLFAGCAVLMVFARRTPYGGTSLRRIALRYRPYAPASIETGDPVFVHTPSPRSSARSSSRHGASTGSSRRPLALLQAESRLITGGRLIGGRRVAFPRWRRWRTTFNPSSWKGDCLFLVLGRLTKQRMAPSSIRRHLREHAEFLLRTHEILHKGMTLAEWLGCLGIPVEHYLARLDSKRTTRWGNTVDVAVASHLYGVRFRMFDLGDRTVIYDSSDTQCGFDHLPPLDIGYHRHHFVAGRLRQQVLDGGRVGGHGLAKTMMAIFSSALLVTVCFAFFMRMCSDITQMGYTSQYALAPSSCSRYLRSGGSDANSTIRHGGMRGRQIAGTGYLNPDGTDRPFDVVGEGVLDRTLHRIPNAHDVAAIEQRYLEDNRVERALAARPLFSAVATDDEYDGEDEPGTGRPPLVRQLRAILGSALNAPRMAVGSSASYSFGLRDFGDNVVHTVLNNHDVRDMTIRHFADVQRQRDFQRPPSPMVLEGGENTSFPRTGRNRAIQQARVVLHSAIGAPHVVEGSYAITVPGLHGVGIFGQHTVLNPNMLPALEDDHIVQARLEARLPVRPYFSAVFSEDESDDESPGANGPGYCRNTNVGSLRFVLGTAAGAPHVIAGLQQLDFTCAEPGDTPQTAAAAVGPEQQLMMAPRLWGGPGTMMRRASGAPEDCFRHGGVRRPYPFGPLASFAEPADQGAGSVEAPEVADHDEAASTVPLRHTKKMATKSTVVLIYHGSFAPLHIGHIECLGRALKHLRTNRVNVIKTVLGFTTAKQVGDKAPGSGLTDIQVRAKIAKDVLSFANMDGATVQVDEHEYSKASELAAAHVLPTATPLYLVGSDVTKKPARETLIVTRTKAEALRSSTGEFYDHAEAKGVCFQTKAFSVSSTWVRQVLLDKRMPLFYSTNAQDIICSALRLKRRTMAQEVAHQSSRQTQVEDSTPQQVDDAAPQEAQQTRGAPGSQMVGPRPVQVSAAMAEEAQPKSKAMPRKARRTDGSNPTGTYGLGVQLRPAVRPVAVAEAPVTDRAPLTRRRPTQEPALDRPPLPRRKKVRIVTIPDEPIEVADEPVLGGRAEVEGPTQRALDLNIFDVPVPPLAHMTTRSGIMKVQPPIMSNLQVYWSGVVIPLCQLLAVTPYLLARRAQDSGALRISYFPQASPPPPYVAFIDTHQMADFYNNLAQVAGNVVNCVWISLHFEGLVPQDCDIDTDRGIATQNMIKAAVTQAERRSLLSAYPASFAMMRVPNLVLLGRPVYAVQAVAIAEEAAELLNIQLDIARATHKTHPGFKFVVDYEHTIFVSGGGGGKRVCLPGDLDKLSQSVKKRRPRQNDDPATIDLNTQGASSCNPVDLDCVCIDEPSKDSQEVVYVPNVTDVEEMFRFVQAQSRSSNHILAFRAGLTARDPMCLGLQQIVDKLEEVIYLKSLTTRLGSTHSLLHHAVLRADQDIGDWANLGQLRRDFIRGMMVDLFLLAECFEIGITVLDYKGHARLHLSRPSIICLQVDAEALVFAVVGVALSTDVVVSGMELAAHDECSQTQVKWQYKVQCLVSAILFSNPPVPRNNDATSPPSSSSSLSSTAQWRSQPDELLGDGGAPRDREGLVQGGARGSRELKRRRTDHPQGLPLVVNEDTPSEDSPPNLDEVDADCPDGPDGLVQMDVHMPEWCSDEFFNIAGSGNGVTIHITTGSEAPVSVQVPEEWSREQIEIALSRHVCARLDWLDFTWIDMDVSMEYSAAFPRCVGDEADALRVAVADLPKGSAHKRSLTQTSEVIVGHRACWKRGLTTFTTTQQEYAKGLVANIVALVPDAVFNAVALVTH